MNHRIDYRKIRVDLINGQIKIKDLRMIPDTSLRKAEHVWAEVTVGVVKLTDFSLKKLLLDKTLIIGDFILLSPEVNVFLPVHVDHQTVNAKAKDTSGVAKAPLLTRITLNRFMIAGGTFRLIRNDVTLAKSEDINFIAQNINLVKNSNDEPLGYSYGDVMVNLSNIVLHSETGLYNMSLDKLSLNKKDSSVVLSGFRMTPKFDKNEFSSKLKFQDDRFDININSVVMKGIGYKRVVSGLPLHISSIILDGLTADIYRDKNVPFNFNKYPLFHNEMFLKANFPLIIDTLAVTGSKIIYGELVAGRTEPGTISLDDFNLQSYHLTNIPEQDSAENVMKLDVQAKVMGEGMLNAELLLPLEGNTREIICSGSVGAMQLSPLNAMLEPSINMKFNAGTVTRMTFYFEGNDNVSNGWMEFLYKDIDVVILKKDEGKEWGFVSFLANKMTHSNNPPPGKTQFKSVSIGYERDKNKGMINFIWKTIQSGMVRTILPISKYEVRRMPDQPKERKKTSQKKK